MILTGLFGYCWAESGAGATRAAAVASNTYGSMRFSPIIRVPSCLVMRCSLSQCSEAPSDAERTKLTGRERTARQRRRRAVRLSEWLGTRRPPTGWLKNARHDFVSTLHRGTG